MAWRAPARAQSAAGGVRRQARSGDCNACARQLEHPQPSAFDKWRESCQSRDVLARFSLLLLPLAGACGATLPQPLQAAPPDEAFVEVPYPPPAALSELVPPQPKLAGVVFQDGTWTWRGSYYVWQRGGWLVPAPGLKSTPWTIKYMPDGRAFFAENRWVDAKGQLTRTPRIIAPASTPPNEVTAEFQTGR